MADKQIKSVTFTGPNGQDVTVTGPAAEVLARDAANNVLDADVEYVEDEKKAAPKAKASDTAK